jgi:hypothetical protein
MRWLSLASILALMGCASTPPARPNCVGAGKTQIDAGAAEEARQLHRDGVAFAAPAVALLGAGLVLGAADIAKAPNDPAWLRGTSLGMLGAGVLATIGAVAFDVMSRQAQERSVQHCVELSSAKR